MESLTSCPSNVTTLAGLEETAAVFPIMTVVSYLIYLMEVCSLCWVVSSLFRSKCGSDIKELIRNIEDGAELEDLVPSEKFKLRCVRVYDNTMLVVSPAWSWASEKWLSAVYWVMVGYPVVRGHWSNGYEFVSVRCGNVCYEGYVIGAGLVDVKKSLAGKVFERLDSIKHFGGFGTGSLSSVGMPHVPVTESWESLFVLVANTLGFFARCVDWIFHGVGGVLGFVKHVLFGMSSDEGTIPSNAGCSKGSISPRSESTVAAQQSSLPPLPETRRQTHETNNTWDNTAKAALITPRSVSGSLESPASAAVPQELDIIHKTNVHKLNPSSFRKPSKFMSFRLTKKNNSSSSTVGTTISTLSSIDEEDSAEMSCSPIRSKRISGKESFLSHTGGSNHNLNNTSVMVGGQGCAAGNCSIC
jgi:hypothetical protein